MTDQVLIQITEEKAIFDISENFRVGSGPIFCADSKYVILFFTRLKLIPQFKKRSVNEIEKQIG